VDGAGSGGRGIPAPVISAALSSRFASVATKNMPQTALGDALRIRRHKEKAADKQEAA